MHPNSQRRIPFPALAGAFISWLKGDDPMTSSQPYDALPNSIPDSLTILPLPMCSYRVDGNYKADYCPSCHGNFQEKEAAVLIPSCRHVFHPQCFGIWLSGSGHRQAWCTLCGPWPTPPRGCPYAPRCSCKCNSGTPSPPYDVSNLPKGVTILALPICSYRRDANYTTKCPTCVDKFKEKQAVVLIRACRHVFHPKCFGKWVSLSWQAPSLQATCPLCWSTPIESGERSADTRSFLKCRRIPPLFQEGGVSDAWDEQCTPLLNDGTRWSRKSNPKYHRD